MRAGFFFTSITLAAICACGSTTSVAPATTGAPAANDSGSPDPHDSPDGSTAKLSPLVGTWDVIFTRGTQQDTATIMLSPTSLEIAARSLQLAVDLANPVPDISFKYARTDSLIATHVTAPLDLGQMPLALGGTWNVQGMTTEHCTADARPEAISLNCINLGTPLEVTLQGYDAAEGVTLGTGNTVAQHKTTLPSIFGDLGGTWLVVTPRASCDVKFQDNTFTATCRRSSEESTTTLTFGDGVASGMTTAGAELSAKRR